MIPGIKDLSVVKSARKGLEEDLRTLDALTRGMSNSLMLSVLLCVLILIVVFRSIKFGIVTIIPVCLVAVWLHSCTLLAII